MRGFHFATAAHSVLLFLFAAGAPGGSPPPGGPGWASGASPAAGPTGPVPPAERTEAAAVDRRLAGSGERGEGSRARAAGVPTGDGDGARGTSDADTARVVAFRDVRLFDGRRVREGVDVVVEGARIAAVGPDLEVPSDARVVDGEGKTLLPGLFDAHVHTFGRHQLRQAVIFGVTTELDMFTVPQTARVLKEEQEAGGATDRAHLLSSGYLATAPGGHGTEYGVQVPTLKGPGDAAEWVDARVGEGSDYIKIVYDDGSAAGVSFPTLELRTVERLVEEAHAHDRLSVVHVSSLEAAREVVSAGADGLAHVWMDSVPEAETIRTMREDGVFVVPTLAVIESVAGGSSGGPAAGGLADDPRLRPYLRPGVVKQLGQSLGQSPSGRGKSRVSLDAALRSVELLDEAGVPLLAGTDAPNPGTAHGPSLHRELELLVEAGLEPEEALAAATSAPARVFGLDDRGRIAEGMRADLLLVEGDPTSDITSTRAVAGVWKAGERVDRQAYRQRVARAREGGAGAAAGEVPAGSESGVVSGFESGDGSAPSARFGAGWQVSTDRMMGGSSRASMRVVDGGADGSSRSLLVEGEVSGESRFPWAGAMFVPGSSMQETVDLSAWDGLSFWTRGDGGTYRLMVFSESLGRRPVTHIFTAGEEWERQVVPFSALSGVDGRRLRAVLFSAGTDAGEFRFRVDDVRFVRTDGGNGE